MQSANTNPRRREQNPAPAEGDGGLFSHPRGVCVKTAIGDPPPPTACLFRFPTREHN
jgi:hypothetical protein